MRLAYTFKGGPLDGQAKSVNLNSRNTFNFILGHTPDNVARIGRYSLDADGQTLTYDGEVVTHEEVIK